MCRAYLFIYLLIYLLQIDFSFGMFEMHSFTHSLTLLNTCYSSIDRSERLCSVCDLVIFFTSLINWIYAHIHKIEFSFHLFYSKLKKIFFLWIKFIVVLLLLSPVRIISKLYNRFCCNSSIFYHMKDNVNKRNINSVHSDNVW